MTVLRGCFKILVEQHSSGILHRTSGAFLCMFCSSSGNQSSEIFYSVAPVKGAQLFSQLVAMQELTTTRYIHLLLFYFSSLISPHSRLETLVRIISSMLLLGLCLLWNKAMYLHPWVSRLYRGT